MKTLLTNAVDRQLAVAKKFKESPVTAKHANRVQFHYGLALVLVLASHVKVSLFLSLSLSASCLAAV